MFDRRQLRLRILEALEQRAKEFRTDEDLYPIRVPREPVPLQDVIDRALSVESHFDPLTLRSRTLLRLEWDDGSAWEAWVVTLPSGLKLFCDAGPEDAHILASGGRFASDETDRQFLQVLCESAGERFGIEMSGGAPSRVWCPVSNREFLVDVFTELFEVTGTEESVRARLGPPHGARSSTADRSDFRKDVDRWLSLSLHPT
jgi:hypothetical protein